MKTIPQSLRTWFVIHFVIDMTFGLPLLFAPEMLLQLFDIVSVETLTARLVGAALVGIGGTSLWMHKGSVDQFKTMLEVKLLWSGSALVAIALAFGSGAPAFISGLAFAIFLVFFFVWHHYYKGLRNNI